MPLDIDDAWENDVPGGYWEEKEQQEAEELAARERNVRRDAEAYVKAYEAKEIAKRLIAEKAALERGPLSSRVLNRSAMRTLDLPKHLMRDVLYTGAVAVVLGDSQVGKSWVTQAIACCAAAGLNWPTMHPNTKGILPVLYIAAEDGGSIEWRVRHWETAHERNLDDSPLYAFVEPMNLLDEVIVEELCDFVREHKIRIVVADTVSATFGGEEESNPEFARLVRHCRRITAAMAEHGGGSVILNHHFGKDKEKGGRGGSSLFNDCDIVWELTGDIDNITMTNKKWKVDEKRKPFHLKLDKSDRRAPHLVTVVPEGSHDVSNVPTETTVMELEIIRVVREFAHLNQGFGPGVNEIEGKIREYRNGAGLRRSVLIGQLAAMAADRRLIVQSGPNRAKWYRLPSVQEQLHDGT